MSIESDAMKYREMMRKQKEYQQLPHIKAKKKAYATEYRKRPGVKEKARAYALEYSRRPEIIKKQKSKRDLVKKAVKAYQEGLKKEVAK